MPLPAIAPIIAATAPIVGAAAARFGPTLANLGAKAYNISTSLVYSPFSNPGSFTQRYAIWRNIRAEVPNKLQEFTERLGEALAGLEYDGMGSDDPDYDEDGNYIGNGRDPNAPSQVPDAPDPYSGLSDNMDSDDPDYDEDGNWIGNGPDPNANSPTPQPPNPYSGISDNMDNNDPDYDEDGNYIGDGNDGGGSGGGDGGSSSGGGKPVVLALDGDGVELVSLEDSTAFYDIDGDGYRERMGWLSADDGLLAYDKNGDGVISGREELSFVDYVPGARTDLEGLAHFDSNGDGRLDASDAEWGRFRVWRDLDQDGESDAGELQTLAEAGITSIALASDGVERTVAGNRILGAGSYTDADGLGALYDAALRYSEYGIREEADGSLTVSLGELRGSI